MMLVRAAALAWLALLAGATEESSSGGGSRVAKSTGPSEGRNVPGAPVFLTGLGSDEPVRPPVSAGPDRSVHRSLLISSGLLLKQL